MTLQAACGTAPLSRCRPGGSDADTYLPRVRPHHARRSWCASGKSCLADSGYPRAIKSWRRGTPTTEVPTSPFLSQLQPPRCPPHLSSRTSFMWPLSLHSSGEEGVRGWADGYVPVRLPRSRIRTRIPITVANVIVVAIVGLCTFSPHAQPPLVHVCSDSPVHSPQLCTITLYTRKYRALPAGEAIW